MTGMLTGVGLGWRPETAWLIHERAGVLGFTEVVAENVCTHGPLPRPLGALVEQGLPIVPHGVSLSLGSAVLPDMGRLDHLARLAERLRAPLVSEHVAFVRGGGLETEHLLPVPRTREMLDILVDNVRRAMAVLPVPLALENIAALFEWPVDEAEGIMDEPAFLAELVARTGAHLLLDLSNLHANARNHGWDPIAYLDALPLSRVAYVHMAGGIERRGFYHDTHAHPVGGGPLALLAALRARAGAALPVLLERDQDFGTRAALEQELVEIGASIGDLEVAGDLERRSAYPAERNRRTGVT